ncbi:hypothetical protein [Pedobacter caeni]|uniref:HEAT repeat-containing protein n=1 Tax=Pedobacter caeni TaxID=288992 RepID=A0A1M5H2L5_9SPHI|nr:hypothetical protein [Pedobacter caeni]SHG10249.1 hypothetical protein SAMN04488522_104479 [Pedobacter caeni]
MTRDKLTARLSASMEARMMEILSGIADQKFSTEGDEEYFQIKDLIDLTFHPKKEVGFRAAWTLEYIFMNHHCAGDHLDDLLSRFPEQKNPSCMRHYGKILAYLTSKHATGLKEGQLAETNFEPVIDILFSWLIDEKVLVATKVHAMQTLANLAPRYTWIKDELLETIAHLEDQETVAFFGRAKQVKKALKKINV